jgi:hypothetical protein
MTVNGIGTLYYGWKPLPDGSAEATCWFVVAFLPVLPLRRERIQLFSATPSDARLPIAQGAGHVIERLPLSWSSVLKTYFMGYVVVPAVLFVPIIVLVAGLYWVCGVVQFKVPSYMLGILALISIVYCGVVVAYILDGAAGRRVGRQ